MRCYLLLISIALLCFVHVQAKNVCANGYGCQRNSADAKHFNVEVQREDSGYIVKIDNEISTANTVLKQIVGCYEGICQIRIVNETQVNEWRRYFDAVHYQDVFVEPALLVLTPRLSINLTLNEAFSNNCLENSCEIHLKPNSLNAIICNPDNCKMNVSNIDFDSIICNGGFCDTNVSNSNFNELTVNGDNTRTRLNNVRFDLAIHNGDHSSNYYENSKLKSFTCNGNNCHNHFTSSSSNTITVNGNNCQNNLKDSQLNFIMSNGNKCRTNLDKSSLYAITCNGNNCQVFYQSQGTTVKCSFFPGTRNILNIEANDSQNVIDRNCRRENGAVESRASSNFEADLDDNIQSFNPFESFNPFQSSNSWQSFNPWQPFNRF